MANEKQTPKSKKTSDPSNSESEEKKTAPKKKPAAEKSKAESTPKAPKSEKTEPVPETAGTEEIQPPEGRPAPEPAADEPEPSATEPQQKEEPIPAVPSAEPADADSDSYIPPPPPAEAESDPLKTFGIYAGVVFLILIVLIVGTSMQNARKYYVVSENGAVEIWKGKFSPMGRERLLVMPGSQPLDTQKDVYTKQDVYPLIFQYHLNKADALMDVSGSPNFEDIKNYLNRALQYATTAEMRSQARARIQTIDRLTLLYKADVAAGRGTPEGYRSALAFLQQAQALDPDEFEANLIQEKIQSVEKQIQALDQKESAAKDEPAELEAGTPSDGGNAAGQNSTAPQPTESGKSSSEQTGSTKEPVDL